MKLNTENAIFTEKAKRSPAAAIIDWARINAENTSAAEMLAQIDIASNVYFICQKICRAHDFRNGGESWPDVSKKSIAALLFDFADNGAKQAQAALEKAEAAYTAQRTALVTSAAKAAEKAAKAAEKAAADFKADKISMADLLTAAQAQASAAQAAEKAAEMPEAMPEAKKAEIIAQYTNFNVPGIDEPTAAEAVNLWHIVMADIGK